MNLSNMKIKIMFFIILILHSTIVFGNDKRGPAYASEEDLTKKPPIALTGSFISKVRFSHSWDYPDIDDFARENSEEELVKLLDDPDWCINSAALRALAHRNKIKEVYVKKVLEKTDFAKIDEFGDAEDSLIDLMLIMPDSSYFPKLKEAFENSEVNTDIKIDILKIFNFIQSEESFLILKGAVTSNDPEIRGTAIRFVSELWWKYPVIDIVLPFAEDKDSKVRNIVAYSLSSIDDTTAVPALIKLCEDEDLSVREASVWALGNLRDKRALSVLNNLEKSLPVENEILNEARIAIRKINGGPKRLSKAENEKYKRIVDLLAHLAKEYNKFELPKEEFLEKSSKIENPEDNIYLSEMVDIVKKYPNIFIHLLRKTCECTHDEEGLLVSVGFTCGMLIDYLPPKLIDWTKYMNDPSESDCFTGNVKKFYDKQNVQKYTRKELIDLSDKIAEDRNLYKELSKEERDTLVRSIWGNQNTKSARHGLLLAATDKEFAGDALYYLKKLNDPELEDPLIQLLKSNSTAVAGVINALAKIKSQKAIPLIIKVLEKESEPGPASVAAAALGDIGNPIAIPSLKTSAKSVNPSIYTNAFVSLAKLGDKSGYDWALKILKDKNFDGLDIKDLYQKAEYERKAIEILSNIGLVKDIELLKTLKIVLEESGRVSFGNENSRAIISIMARENLYLDDWSKNLDNKYMIIDALSYPSYVLSGLDVNGAEIIKKDLKCIENITRSSINEIMQKDVEVKELLSKIINTLERSNLTSIKDNGR